MSARKRSGLLLAAPEDVEKLGLRMHAELRKDRREMVSHRARGDEKCPPDRRDTLACRDAGEDLELTRRQLGIHSRVSLARIIGTAKTGEPDPGPREEIG